MKIFLSWSGEVSHEVAKTLHGWLPCVLQGVQTFISSDISKGDRWNDVLADELKEAQYGIICVTPFNIHKPWMNFEAGALSRVLNRAFVMPFLFHVAPDDLEGPLAQFQSTVYDHDDVRAMVRSINNHRETPLNADLLDRTFEKWWGDLEAQLDEVSMSTRTETRTYYPWLYTRADLDVNSIDAEYKSAWIVANNADRYLDVNMKEKIRAACEVGKTFRYFLPSHEEYEYQSELESLVRAYPDRVAFKLFAKDEFERQAPADYIILNPDGDGDLRVLVKLPLEEHGQQEYWFKTNDRSARSFVSRFRKLWDAPQPAAAPKAAVHAQPGSQTQPRLSA
jgi:hypothetical protein